MHGVLDRDDFGSTSSSADSPLEYLGRTALDLVGGALKVQEVLAVGASLFSESLCKYVSKMAKT